MKASSDALRGKPGLAMVGLLLVEMIIGYEWLVSGVAKFVRGGFPSGLAKVFPAIQIVIATVSTISLKRLRRTRTGVVVVVPESKRPV